MAFMPKEENRHRTAWDAVKYEVCFGGYAAALAAGASAAIVLEPTIPFIIKAGQVTVTLLLATLSGACLIQMRRKLRSVQPPSIR